MIKVLIADDHGVVREGLAHLLGLADDIEVVGTARDGEQAVLVALARRPDVVLMDLVMPGMDGNDATRRLREADPRIAVVALTSFSERDQVLGALDAGAVGYLLKDSEPDVIEEGVRAAARGGSPLDPEAARSLVELRAVSRAAAGLTAREHEVLALLAEGLPNKRIAAELGISEKTVKRHITSVFRRIGVSDRTHAALWARDHGLARSSRARGRL